jgi:hypothetical protein
MDPTPSAESFRWSDLDQTLVSTKLEKLTKEIQGAFVKVEAEIGFEGRKRGNGAYFLPTFLAKQVERTDEYARRKYELYCECVYEQGRCVSPAFLREVYANAIKLFIQVRKDTIADHFARRAHITGERLNQHCFNRFAREMDALGNTWFKTTEADAKSLEHNSLFHSFSCPLPASLPEIRQAIVDCQSRLTEINLELEAQKEALVLASANGGPGSKIRQAIRQLSVAKANLEEKRERLLLIFAEQGKKSFIGYKAEFSRTKRAARNRPLCFETAIALMSKSPDLNLVQFCRKMDSDAEKFRSALKYLPPKSWKTRTFYEQYQKRANTVSRFLSAVRSEARRRSKKEEL